MVDEQHRFGVEQRAALTDKAGSPPHVLVMTATPIPRTVAMTVFGDLETSVLAELPAGRAPIQTNVVPLADQPGWIERAWQRVREEVEKGHQVYVVCPRISGDASEDGETDQLDLDDEGNEIPPKRALAAVEDVHAELAAGPLQGLRTAVLHGRLAPDAKDATMRSFAAGEIDVLVATTVIEVGVDVHNATMMVLLDADRFGISQLHQLRGRVGRGGLPGLCLLVSHAEVGSPARDRLDAVASTTDGFELSRVDLEQRREGDVLGASQSGLRSGLVSLRVLRDEKTIIRAREAAEALLSEDPTLGQSPDLAAVVDRGGALSGVGIHGEGLTTGNDAHHRGNGGRPASGDAARPVDPTHERPGARGPLLRDRGAHRLPRRSPLPRPLRRLGRGRPRGPVPRRRCRDARRARPAYGRADHPQRHRARLLAGPGRRRVGGDRPAVPAGRALRPGLLRPALPGARRGRRRRPAALVAHGWLVPGALVVVERASKRSQVTWPDGIVEDRMKRYGETALWYGHATPALTSP